MAQFTVTVEITATKTFLVTAPDDDDAWNSAQGVAGLMKTVQHTVTPDNVVVLFMDEEDA